MNKLNIVLQIVTDYRQTVMNFLGDFHMNSKNTGLLCRPMRLHNFFLLNKGVVFSEIDLNDNGVVFIRFVFDLLDVTGLLNVNELMPQKPFPLIIKFFE